MATETGSTRPSIPVITFMSANVDAGSPNWTLHETSRVVTAAFGHQPRRNWQARLDAQGRQWPPGVNRRDSYPLGCGALNDLGTAIAVPWGKFTESKPATPLPTDRADTGVGTLCQQLRTRSRLRLSDMAVAVHLDVCVLVQMMLASKIGDVVSQRTNDQRRGGWRHRLA
jgi:hypothetical protein